MIFKLTADLLKNREVFVKKYYASCNLDNILKFYTHQCRVNVLKTVENIYTTKNRIISVEKTILFY